LDQHTVTLEEENIDPNVAEPKKKRTFVQKVKKKFQDRNWTYILRIGSFLSGGGAIVAGSIGLLPPPAPPLTYIVCIYLIILGAILIGVMIPWPKTWRKLTVKYIPFLHTYRGRGLYIIFIGTISIATTSGVLSFISTIIGIVLTIIGLMHCIIAFFFKDALNPKAVDLDQPDGGEPANMNTLKQEIKQAAVKAAWDNKDKLAKTAYDNRQHIAQNSDKIGHAAVNYAST